MPQTIEKRCSKCDALLCKTEGRKVEIKAKKGIIYIEPKDDTFHVECDCGQPNTITVAEINTALTGTITRIG
jgi:hypothetical protein